MRCPSLEERRKLSRRRVPRSPTLLLLLFCLTANAALAARVEFVGDYSFDIDQGANSVTVEVQELRNPSGAATTGPLFLSLRHTECDAPASPGLASFEVDYEADEAGRPGLYPLDRVVAGGDSSLAPQRSWTGIRFTTRYRPPPAGTWRRHLAVFELDVAEIEEGTLELIGAATFPYRHVQRGREDYDSCFTAMTLDANGSHRGYISLLDSGDYYRLQSWSRGALVVEIDQSFDAVAQLLDVEGRLLTAGEADDGSGNARIRRQVDDRVYYLRIAPGPGGYGNYGNYTLRSAVTPGAAGAARDRDDDTLKRASPLRLGEEVGDAIDVAGDIDWWTFETDTRGRFAISTTGEADTFGSLFDASVEVLASDDDSGDLGNFRIDDSAIVEPGAYYLKVEGGRAATTGPYTLRVAHIPEDESGLPDLVVGLPDAGSPELAPGEPFVFAAEVRNRGNGASAPSAVRLYRSANRVISTGDEVAVTEGVDALAALATSDRFLRFGGAAAAGRYYLGACVRAVQGETDAHNNCSGAVRVMVRDTPADTTEEPAARRHSLPLVLSASDGGREGFVRIINRSDEAGTLLIHAVDDAGILYGPVEIAMSARETVHFNSRDLESGNLKKGMAGGIGPGQGDWRLEVVTELDIAPLAYVRTSDGFLTSMHETAAALDDGRYYVPFFNPASNTRQVSSLRLVNPGTEDAGVSVTGLDDRGDPPPEGSVWLTVPAGEARLITADELESGAGGLQGRFGSGSGKWRLFLSADASLEVSSLLESPTGNLANLSSRGRERSLPLVLPAAGGNRVGFVRLINWSDVPGEVRIHGIDDSGRRTDAVTLRVDAAAVAHFNSEDLESGNESKGLSGGIGQGTGGWRLELDSDLEVEALAYVRTADGFVTGMHGLAVGAEGIVDVPFLNPASNTSQESRLRLINPGETEALATVTGHDDNGAAPPYGLVRLTIPPGETRTITARQLETGANGLKGRFGDGAGKWRLEVASEQPIEVMSLLESPTGNLTNLSLAGAGTEADVRL